MNNQSIDIEKVKEFILSINAGAPTEEVNTGDTKNGKFIFNRKIQQNEQEEQQQANPSTLSSGHQSMHSTENKDLDNNNKKVPQLPLKPSENKLNAGHFQLDNDNSDDEEETYEKGNIDR